MRQWCCDRFLSSISLFVLACFFLLSLPSSHAGMLGVSKGVMEFNEVLKSGYAEDTVYISTDIPENVSLVWEVDGPFEEWITVREGTELVMSKDHGQWLTVIVTPPADTPNGVYDGILRVTTGPIGRTFEGRIGSNVLAAFAIQIRVVITGKEVISCVPGGFFFPDGEVGSPLDARVTIQNNGNVRITPRLVLEIWDQTEKTMVATKNIPLNQEVLPTTSTVYYPQITDLNLPIGQYFVQATIPECKTDPSLVTFSILERGGVSDTGNFLRIENPYWANVSDIVPIDALFMNTGNRSVSAKFKGTISLGKAVVKVIDTDPVTILPSETMKITTYFQPDKEGQYEISGRVLYNTKLSFEQGSVLNVLSTGESQQAQQKKQNIFSFLPYLIIVIIIFLFIFLIRKKQRKHR
jgi:hypothetical protein